jgi:uncharacterized membrane protein YphA (DoxX/SURF4 family)
MLGLATPVAAAGAAVQLAMFYLATPPWPGLPALSTEGHYLFVNRNLIELLAVLALMTVPVGRWAGLDFWIGRRNRRSHKIASKRSWKWYLPNNNDRLAETTSQTH